MRYILKRYHPEIGNWCEPVEPEVNDGVHCHHVRYRGIVITPIENENSPNYKKEIFDDGSPYDFDYLRWFVSCLKDKDTASKLTSILCQNPTVFMELDFVKSDNEYVHLPCDDVDSPDNVVYPTIKDLVDASITYRIKQQKDDGRWTQGWAMGEDEGVRKL